jgi:alpha-glucosidase (family GH31 glycosyl hydrolase)
MEIRATSHRDLVATELQLADGSALPMLALGSTAGGRKRWSVELQAPAAGKWLTYRIADPTGAARTRWWRVAPASWEVEGGWSERRENAKTVLVATPSGATGGTEPRVQTRVAWLRGADGVHRLRFAMPLAPGERLIGFGERYDRLDQRGNRLDVRVFEPYKRQWAGTRTYLPMPFFISSAGWGAWLTTSRRVWFDAGASDPGLLQVEADVDSRDPRIELVIVQGTPQEVLAAFLESSGPAERPPDWIFRPWMSSNEWNSQERVMAEVGRGEELGFPAGVVVIEAWSDEKTFVAFRDAQYPLRSDGGRHRLSDFTFPVDGAWPNPKGMVEELHARNMRLLLWQVPVMKRRRDLTTQSVYDWERMIGSGYAVRRVDGTAYRNRGWWFPDGLLLDFTNPAARDWWLSKRRYLVEDLGIDGFKTDGGEHAWGDDLRYADGRSGADVNNEYPVHYQAAYHELLRTYRPDGVTFSRSGFVGSARYPAFWAGDEDSTWEAFRGAIIAGQQAGVCGIFFWGWDIAGFSGEVPDAELYLRSTAMAAFCPIMQYHSEFNPSSKVSRDRTPWNIAKRSGDPAVIDVSKRFAQLRERLVPYLVREAAHSVSASLPLMRPLGFDAPSDDTAWEFPFQYRLGRQLVVAPVTQPSMTSWPVYLPAGNWVDLWRSQGPVIEGPASVDREVPLDIVPVYVLAEDAGALQRELALD